MPNITENKLIDFFKYFNPNLDKHIEAVNELYKLLPDSAKDQNSEWIKKYRGAVIDEVEFKKPPYFKQLDSQVSGQAYRSCFSSSSAMFLESHKPGTLKGKNGDDEFLRRVFTFGDTTDPQAQIKALKSFGLDARFRMNLQWKDIDIELDKNQIVPIGILHHGSLKRPYGGHWIVITGKSKDGLSYQINDPYGELNLINGTYDILKNGEGLWYSKKNLTPRFIGANGGWGIVL